MLVVRSVADFCGQQSKTRLDEPADWVVRGDTIESDENPLRYRHATLSLEYLLRRLCYGLRKHLDHVPLGGEVPEIPR